MPTLRRAPRSEATRAQVDAGADIVDKTETPGRSRDKVVEQTTPQRRSGGDVAGGDDVPATSPAKDGGDSAEAAPSAKIPTLVQFPLVAAISFTTASLGYSLVAELTKGELAGVSRSQETWQEIGILAGWRM